MINIRVWSFYVRHGIRYSYVGIHVYAAPIDVMYNSHAP